MSGGEMREIAQSEFREMERRDEDQIVAEMKGDYLREFVYQFQSGGRTVTGISWAGIKEIAYKMGNIQVDLVDLKETDKSYVAIVKATDTLRNNSRLGASTQLKMMKRRDGSEEEDSFALQKAISKSQRNAIRPLIPEVMMKTWLEKFLEYQKTGEPPPAQDRKPVNSVQTPSELSVPSLMGYLREGGVDVSLLGFEDELYAILVTPLKWLGDDWGPLNDLLKPLGASWMKPDKGKAHWRIPKPEEPPEEEPPQAKPPKAETPKPAPLQKPGSMQELEYILDGKFPGASELFTVVPGAKAFLVEATGRLDQELVLEIGALAERMGRVQRLKPGSLSEYVWEIPKGEAEG